MGRAARIAKGLEAAPRAHRIDAAPGHDQVIHQRDFERLGYFPQPTGRGDIVRARPAHPRWMVVRKQEACRPQRERAFDQRPRARLDPSSIANGDGLVGKIALGGVTINDMEPLGIRSRQSRAEVMVERGIGSVDGRADEFLIQRGFHQSARSGDRGAGPFVAPGRSAKLRCACRQHSVQRSEPADQQPGEFIRLVTGERGEEFRHDR